MALIQVLVHEKTMVLGSVLERLKADLGRSLQFASPIYRTELADDRPNVLAARRALRGHPHRQPGGALASRTSSNKKPAHFARAVAMGDRDAVVRRFRQVAGRS